jgi:hypothetical protein
VLHIMYSHKIIYNNKPKVMNFRFIKKLIAIFHFDNGKPTI